MSIFTPADVIASYKTHGDAWMRFDLLKKRTPKNGNVVTYVPILVRKANSETYGRLVLKFIMQIVSSKPKTFKGNGNNTNDQSKKKLSIAFRQITREDFERSTVHKSETYDKFIESSSELIKALTIIDNSFQKLCEKYESDLSNITTNKTIYSIKQTERKMKRSLNQLEIITLFLWRLMSSSRPISLLLLSEDSNEYLFRNLRICIRSSMNTNGNLFQSTESFL
jgi:hypothetical protein